MEKESANKLPSNEEVIEELTRDLDEFSVAGGGDEKSEEPLKIHDVEDDETETKIPEPDRDFVDEEALKSRDLNLSEDEKKEYRQKAEDLKNDANKFFKDLNYEEAALIYTKGLNVLPLEFKKERAILFANRAAAKSKFLSEKEPAIADCTKAVELDPEYLKAFLRRAHLYEETEKLQEALEDYKKVLSFDPSHIEAMCAVRKLPPLIEEQNEKLKTEMLGKLKDLGNMILKPFGLSTQNFEMQKDPNSGGYSVKFNQNPT